jgi:hypothetical protein
VANKNIFLVDLFFGGISESPKVGVKGSFYYGENLDFKSDLSAVTAQIAPIKQSSTTITDLPKWIEKDPVGGKTYAYDASGGFYSATSGTWSALTTPSTSHGEGMKVWQDYVYLRKDSAISRWGPISSSPSLTQSWQTSNVQTLTDHGPIVEFIGNLYLANGRYLGEWDSSVWTYNKLTMPVGWNIRCMAVVGDRLVMGGWKGTNVSDNERGFLWTWNGTDAGITDFVEVTEGAVNAMAVYDNTLWFIAGSVGNLYYYDGNTIKIRQITNFLEQNKYVDIYPGAMTAHRGDLFIGVAGATDSTTITQGVYTYGRTSKNYPRALNIPNIISTGTKTGTGLKIGSLHAVGPNEFYIGWHDGSANGVDLISGTTPYTSATWYSLWFDNGHPYHEKETDVIKFTHKPLAANESMDFYYRIDRTTSWVQLTPNATQAVGDTETRCPVTPMFSWKEIQLRVDIKTSGTTSPSLISAAVLFSEKTYV